MSVEKIPSDTGKVKVAKALINTPQAMRYTISTFDPNITSNPVTLWQGGSRACDAFPGTNETFGGEINGYGEITPLGDGVTADYTIYYLYDGINPIVEYSPNGSILARYVYAGGLHIAKIAGADTSWYHCDALGSPRKMTDERGDVVWTATYYPFGEMTAGSSNTHGFTGKEYDSEMSLNYFCQRYYDPQIGRFMSVDPEDRPASSPYAYCANNPFRFVDPTGAAMQVPMPDEGGGGYDATWWALYNMMEAWEMHEAMEARRAYEKFIADYIVRNGLIENISIDADDIENAERWIRENCGFLSEFFNMAEIKKPYIVNESGVLDNLCQVNCENPTTGQSEFSFTFGSMQDNNTWSIRAHLAHEFAEIIYCKYWPGVSGSWVCNAQNPGHFWADRWVRARFVWDSYYGYIKWWR